MRQSVALLLCIVLAGCFKLPSPPPPESGASVPSEPAPAQTEPAVIIAPDGLGMSGPCTVRVLKAEWKNVTLNDGFRQRGKILFVLTVNLRNTSKTKIVDYQGWSAGGSIRSEAELKDNFDNRFRPHLRRLAERIDDTTGHARLRPGEETTDLLAFDEPLPNVSYLRLSLPHLAVSESSGRLLFHVPASAIEWLAPKGKVNE